AQRIALQQFVERKRRRRLVGRDPIEDVALPGAPFDLPDAERQREHEDRQHHDGGPEQRPQLEHHSSSAVERWMYCWLISSALRTRSSTTDRPKVSGGQTSAC